ncbi:hypothetical protein REJC140_00529 [Pseudorhizobium endolithicum]|uniref:Aspartyl-tRNA synthetase n=1 Tax=Pseudorhizobium endolithicum TaxID=1191678 RepID=A0ABM8PEL0_9HYPH|nr:SH3 domain-containing protein [Pseudorhizobium endolithicum]CAD7024785.1 hypothetical protein REJC140_00529 [Pseudorhizobium endolithicum]
MSGMSFPRRCAAAVLAAITAFGPLHPVMPAVRPAVAADVGSGFRSGRETGYPVPRFVSLKAARARMRIGPSTDYATKWIYTQRGLPLEITEEYGNWRRVRDFDGVTGWMSGALLSGDRTAVVGPWLREPIPLRRAGVSGARITAQLAPKVLMQVGGCDGRWCRVSLPQNNLEGYVEQSSLWGVYPGERFE